jgi:hypothetical protein
VQLVNGSNGAGLNALSRTLFLALDRRDRAIEDIRVLAPPAPRSEDIARVRARNSQEEDEVVTFDTVMPNTIAQFDDELQTIAGTLTDATDLTAGGRRLLNRAADQVTAPGPGSTLWRRSRPRIDIDGGRPVPAAASPLFGPRPAQCAGRRSPSWEERRPRTEGGCAGGVGRLRSGRRS